MSETVRTCFDIAARILDRLEAFTKTNERWT
jgi:hypothetical protein